VAAFPALALASREEAPRTSSLFALHPVNPTSAATAQSTACRTNFSTTLEQNAFARFDENNSFSREST
jgi:hypothetical protein